MVLVNNIIDGEVWNPFALVVRMHSNASRVQPTLKDWVLSDSFECHLPPTMHAVPPFRFAQCLQRGCILRDEFDVVAKIRRVFATAFKLFGFSTDPDACRREDAPPFAHWDASHTFLMHFRDDAGLFSNLCMPAAWHMMLKSPTSVRILLRHEHDYFFDDVMFDNDVCAASQHTVELKNNWEQTPRIHPVWIDADAIQRHFPDLEDSNKDGVPYGRVDIYLSDKFDAFRRTFLHSMFARGWGRFAFSEPLERRADHIWTSKGMSDYDTVIGLHGRFSGHFYCKETKRDMSLEAYLDDVTCCLEDRVLRALAGCRERRVAVWISTHIQPMLDEFRKRIGTRFRDQVAIVFNDETQRLQHNLDWTESKHDAATLRNQAATDTLLLARCDVVIGGASNMMLYIAGRRPHIPIVVPNGLQVMDAH